MLSLKSVMFPQSLIYERRLCFKRHGKIKNNSRVNALTDMLSLHLRYAERKIEEIRQVK